MKFVEEKLIKIHDYDKSIEHAEKELIVDREIIAEESVSVADKDDKLHFKRKR